MKTVMQVAAALALSAGSVAMADNVFYESFNGENAAGGFASYLNYGDTANNGTTFAQWEVSSGTVDIIRNQEWGFVPAARRLVVDLDGSSNNAGVLTSMDINTVIGKTYTLTFDMAGNSRGGNGDSVSINITLNALNQTLNFAWNAAWTTYSFTFVATASPSNIIFSNAGGDNVGALLDNVTLQLVPAPQAAGLGLLGLGLVASRRRLAKLVKRA